MELKLVASKLEDISIPATFGMTNDSDCIRILELNLELRTTEQSLLQLVETSLFNPEIWAAIGREDKLRSLKSLSDMKVPSDPESIRALAG